METEIGTLKSNNDNLKPAEAKQNDAPAANAEQEVNLAEQFLSLETKTKGGFGKVKEDIKKLADSVEASLAAIPAGLKSEDLHDLKTEIITAQTKVEEEIGVL